MLRTITTTTVLAAVLATAASASAATIPGHVVGHGQASGDFAVAAASATVNHPHALYVRLVGRVSGGTVVVACSRGYSVSSRSADHNRAGIYRLPMTPRADSCNVVASVSGAGRVRVEIRAS